MVVLGIQVSMLNWYLLSMTILMLLRVYVRLRVRRFLTMLVLVLVRIQVRLLMRYLLAMALLAMAMSLIILTPCVASCGGVVRALRT